MIFSVRCQDQLNLRGWEGFRNGGCPWKSWILGPEFPAMIGGLIGLGIIVAGAKKGFCVPKDIWDFGPQKTWPAEWTGCGV